MKKNLRRAGEETKRTVKKNKAKESVFVKTLRVYLQPVLQDYENFEKTGRFGKRDIEINSKMCISNFVKN